MSRVIRLDSKVSGTDFYDKFNNDLLSVQFDWSLVDIIEVVNPSEWQNYQEFVDSVAKRSIGFQRNWIVKPVIQPPE